MSDWNDDNELILKKIGIMSSELSDFHKDKYYYYKNMLKYFKIPVIILSSINSVIAIGLSTFIIQTLVSVITCIISLISAMLGSIELYLGIQKTMEIELDSSKQFKILSYDIFKNLTLRRENRNINGKTYLEEKYSEFIKLLENSTLMDKKLNDLLTPKLKTLSNKKSFDIESIDSLNSLLSSISNSPKNEKNDNNDNDEIDNFNNIIV